MTREHDGPVCEPPHGEELAPDIRVASPAEPASVDRTIAQSAVRPLRWAWPGPLSLTAAVGGHRDAVVQVFNDDDRPRTPQSIRTTGSRAFAVTDVSHWVIPPLASATMRVRFAPQEVRREQAQLVIVTANEVVGIAKDLVGDAIAPRRDPDWHPAREIEPTSAAAPTGDNSKNTWKLAAPNRIELGEHVVGRSEMHTSSIFALGRDQGPRISARVLGDESIKLVAAPTFLPGAGRPYDETSAFRFECKATRKGKATSTLEVTVQDAPHEVFRFPIVATAHDPGEPTFHEEQQQIADRAREAQQARERADDHKRVDHAIETEHENPTPRHAGHERHLQEQADRAQAALRALYTSRADGVQAASDEIGEFHRRKPAPEQPSLLAELAWLALDIATAGTAGGIARRIEGPVTELLTKTVPEGPHWLPARPHGPARVGSTAVPGRAVVAVVTDGIKEAIKRGGQGGARRLRDGAPSRARDGVTGGATVGRTSTGETYALSSTNPKVAFFEEQREILNAESEMRATEVATRTQTALLPTLRVAPEKAIGAMTRIADGIAAERDHANRIATEQSVRKWTSYVGETSGTSMNAMHDEQHPLARLDGVVDLDVVPDLAHPEKPVAVTRARLDGVRRDVVARFGNQPLINLDIPVRVVGNFNSPTATLTAVRHSGGKIEYTENTTVDWRRGGKWLERKAAANGRGRDAEWGARILLEKEIMQKTLLEHTDSIENDSDE